VMRVNSANVLDEGLRIGGRGRRMNSKVGFQKKRQILCIESKLELVLDQSQCVPDQPLLDPFIGGQVSRNRSGSTQITIRVTTQSLILTMIILRLNFHGPLPERIPVVLR
jgi:hypothetical protein